MVLDAVSTALLEHRAANSGGSLTQVSKKTGVLKKSERIGELMGLSGLLLLGTFIIIFLISLGLSKLIGFNLNIFDAIGPVTVSVALPMLFVGVGLRLYPTLSKELFGGKQLRSSALSQADTTQKLIDNRPAESMPVEPMRMESKPSVTEGTTRTLEP